MNTPLTEDHPLRPLLDEEQRCLAMVQLNLTTRDLKDVGKEDYDSVLLDLRDQLAEARLEDVPALVDQMIQAQAVRSRRGLSRALPADPQNPYFGHLRLEENGRTRDVLIGKRSFIDSSAGISIVDWRNAPVSRIFYRYEEGDLYEEEFGERLVAGKVLAKRTVSVSHGKLTRIRSPEGTLVADGKGAWWVLAPQAVPELHGGRGTAVRPPRENQHVPSFRVRQQQRERGQLGLGGEGVLREDKRLPEIAALIDREQFDLITRPDAGVVVLQGGAGSGKTTVLLHRVAYLHFNDPQRFRTRHMRVIVSQPALVNYIGKVLPSLDVGGLPVVTMSDFLLRLRQQVCPRIKRKRVEDAPDAVSRLKKHPAMLKLLDEQVAGMVADMRAELEESTRKLPGGGDVVQKFDAGTSLLSRLLSLKRHLPTAPQPIQDRVGPWLRRAMTDLEDPLGPMQEWLSDRKLIREVFERHAPGTATEGMVEALVSWVDRQATEPDDDSHVDIAARTPVDSAGEDDTDPTWRLDPMDDALMIRLHQLWHGGLVPPGQSAIEFDHVAVDEAQDLSALEIQILADATQRQCLTLAGDTMQRLVFDNAFDSWTGLLSHLRLPTLNVSTLRVAYRSTREVTEVAREILGPLADKEAPVTPRSGAPVEAWRFAELGEEVAFLSEAIRGLMGRERDANLALITRYPAQADTYYQALYNAEVPFIRRVARQDFSFTPGVDVTDVTQVKGLEYDYVIMAGVDLASYPDSVESRHLLHIGATRAAHQLWFVMSGTASQLIPRHLLQQG
ncbi:MAG: ATP-binding domain-containing protein [Myxococcota bacterium]